MLDMTDNFRKTKLLLFKKYLSEANLEWIKRLYSLDVKWEVDNFISLNFDKGSLNIYLLWPNPIFDFQEDYLKMDTFNLYSIYENLKVIKSSIIPKWLIHWIQVIFAKNYDEIYGVSLILWINHYHILFMHDEINIFFDQPLINCLQNNLMHISHEDFEIISLK